MLVINIVSLAEALTLTFFLRPPLLCCLAVAREVLARRHAKVEVLMFDLVALEKA